MFCQSEHEYSWQLSTEFTTYVILQVTRDTHHYLHDIEEREEGGTPAIVESIRAGLTFKVKNSIGTDIIGEREEELTS